MLEIILDAESVIESPKSPFLLPLTGGNSLSELVGGCRKTDRKNDILIDGFQFQTRFEVFRCKCKHFLWWRQLFCASCGIFLWKSAKVTKTPRWSGCFFYLCVFSRIFSQKIVAFEHFTNAKKCDIMTRRSEKGACARRSILARSVNLMAPTRATDSYQPCIFWCAYCGTSQGRKPFHIMERLKSAKKLPKPLDKRIRAWYNTRAKKQSVSTLTLPPMSAPGW